MPSARSAPATALAGARSTFKRFEKRSFSNRTP